MEPLPQHTEVEVNNFYDDLVGKPGLEKIISIGKQRKSLEEAQIRKAALLEMDEFLRNSEYPGKISIVFRVYARAKLLPLDTKRTWRQKYNYWMKYGEWR